MQTNLQEIMPELFTRSEVLIWNFAEIDNELDANKNIKRYMHQQEVAGKDPCDAFHRQEFNEQILTQTNSRYLIGRYGENRVDILGRGSHMAKEGRIYHLAIDIFSRDQEQVTAPCDGEVVVSDYEPGLHNYGNYVIMRPNDKTLPYIFFGHLANDKHELGSVRAGEKIATLGSFKNLENGGWSIHLHLQLLKDLPPKGEAPIGYSTLQDLPMNQKRFPDPQTLFPGWRIRR